MHKKAKMRMRMLPADTPLKSGESWQKELLETENSEWVWTCFPIVHGKKEE